MMKEIKRSLKLMRYGYQLKVNLGMAALFFGLSIAMLLVGHAESIKLGSVYLVLPLMMPIQILYNLLHSQIVASSYRRRSLDGLVPNILMLGATILAYAIIVILVGVRSKVNPENANNYYITLVVIGLSLLFVTLFFAAAFKWFVFSFVIFMVGFLFVYMGGTVVTMMEKVSLTFTNAALLGLVFVIAGNLIGMGIKRALYRKPISLLSAGGQLKKELR